MKPALIYQWAPPPKKLNHFGRKLHTCNSTWYSPNRKVASTPSTITQPPSKNNRTGVHKWRGRRSPKGARVPNKPPAPCPNCRRLGCNNPGHHRGKGSTFKTWAQIQRRAQTVQAWRTNHGDTCPGWQRDPHPATDLTADHLQPVAAGGTETGPLSVLCRSCNGRKQANR